MEVLRRWGMAKGCMLRIIESCIRRAESLSTVPVSLGEPSKSPRTNEPFVLNT